MNDIILSTQNGEPVVSSREVAGHFGKEHKDTLESIRQILAAENSATKSMFYETTFENRGKQYPMYLMNRDGFSLLAMGFTGKAALEWKLKYIEAFNQMEKQLTEQKAASLDPSLPPELAMVEGLLNSMKQVCMTQKQQGTAIEQVTQRMDVMCEAMTTSVNDDWRTACTNAIRAVAFKRGGGKHYEAVWSEVYDELLGNGFDIRRRLENRRKNAIAAGMSKSFVNKINALDVIADSKDKKLTSAFISSVRRIAAAESVRMDKLDSVAVRPKM